MCVCGGERKLWFASVCPRASLHCGGSESGQTMYRGRGSEDSAAFRELQELLDDPVPYGNKSGSAKSHSKVGLIAKGAKKS